MDRVITQAFRRKQFDLKSQKSKTKYHNLIQISLSLSKTIKVIKLTFGIKG